MALVSVMILINHNGTPGNLCGKLQVTYLGMTLQVSGTTFSVHIKERLAAAIRSISDIRHLYRMPLETAMKIFRTKALRTLIYGLE